MSRLIVSKKKAYSISFALFLIGIAILFFVDSWWPSIALVIGIPLALRQYLLGAYRDMIVSLIVFLGIFITVQFAVPWKFLLPGLFLFGGFYILVIELFMSKPETEREKEEEISHEIEEDHKK